MHYVHALNCTMCSSNTGRSTRCSPKMVNTVCSLCAMPGRLPFAICSMCIVQCVVRSVLCAVCCDVWCVQCALCIVQCRLPFAIHVCSMCSVHCAVCCVLCAVCSVDFHLLAWPATERQPTPSWESPLSHPFFMIVMRMRLILMSLPSFHYVDDAWSWWQGRDSDGLTLNIFHLEWLWGEYAEYADTAQGHSICFHPPTLSPPLLFNICSSSIIFVISNIPTCYTAFKVHCSVIDTSCHWS